jgi:pimeloyl-ACP methyl ester carboxylesterase
MDLPDGWSHGTLSANGVDLAYYRTGDGDPIVLAHGMYANGRCWLRLGSELADEHEVIAYDARGHGRSDAPESGYDLDTRVADLVGVVSELGVEDPVLGGHSMGAATVAWAAAEHPELPRGVFLEDPSRFRGSPETSVETARKAGRERLRESKSRSVAERVERHYEEAGRDDHDEAQVRRLAVATGECSPHVVKVAQEHPPVAEAFDDVACPTLVLRRDVGVDERVADLNAAGRLADGRLVHVPDAGHHVFLDRYDAATAELRAFLSRL